MREDIVSLALKLTVEQISTAILLLNKDEKTKLRKHLPVLMDVDAEELEEMRWLSLAESAFDFWNDPEEDVYDDLVVAGSEVMRTIS